MWIVRGVVQVPKDSVQKLELNIFSSFNKQDFREDVRKKLNNIQEKPELIRIHGRYFLISMLMCRKMWRKSLIRQEFIEQRFPVGTRISRKQASVPKPAKKIGQNTIRGCRIKWKPTLLRHAPLSLRWVRGDSLRSFLRFGGNRLSKTRRPLWWPDVSDRWAFGLQELQPSFPPPLGKDPVHPAAHSKQL